MYSFQGFSIVNARELRHTYNNRVSLHRICPSTQSTMAIIAIDCDDTLSRTNETITKWHNDNYGTDLTIQDFNHFQYWRVRGWGDRTEAQRKVREFNRSAAWDKIPVIQEAITGVKALKAAGHELVIITARMASEAARTRDWIEETFGVDTFSEIYFTSAFESRSAAAPDGQDEQAAKEGPESVASRHHLQYMSIPKPKSEICKLVNAKMLIDDSIENAYEVHYNAGIPVCLYGDWNWNKKTMNQDAANSPKSYQERLDSGEVEDPTDAQLPDGIVRCVRWADAVETAKRLL